MSRHIQQALHLLGRQKGYLTRDDFKKMYSYNANKEIEKWLLLNWIKNTDKKDKFEYCLFLYNQFMNGIEVFKKGLIKLKWRKK